MMAQPSDTPTIPPNILCKLGEGVLCPIIQVINEAVKQFWLQYQPLGYITNGWSSDGLWVADKNPLSTAVQPVFSTPHCLFM